MNEKSPGLIVAGFIGTITLFGDGFIFEEYEADGTFVAGGLADSIMHLGSFLETVDVDEDDQPVERVVHWINLRLGGNEGERPHVRKVVAMDAERFPLKLVMDDGRKLLCYEIHDDNDPQTLATIEDWRREKAKDRETYEIVGENLRLAALDIAGLPSG